MSAGSTHRTTATSPEVSGSRTGGLMKLGRFGLGRRVSLRDASANSVGCSHEVFAGAGRPDCELATEQLTSSCSHEDPRGLGPSSRSPPRISSRRRLERQSSAGTTTLRINLRPLILRADRDACPAGGPPLNLVAMIRRFRNVQLRWATQASDPASAAAWDTATDLQRDSMIFLSTGRTVAMDKREVCEVGAQGNGGRRRGMSCAASGMCIAVCWIEGE
ncbi:hypothetical protein DFH09DRAFT_1092418 [Mycena vulgaris]|nr:hypothetical protein DFH09DRAFT_1092418 [Mycena vulgaris]